MEPRIDRKTPYIRALEALVASECFFVEIRVPRNIRTASEVAETCRVCISGVVKTVALRTGAGPVLVCCCGDEEAPLGLVAEQMGVRASEVNLLDRKTLRTEMGMEPGAITPLGAPSHIPVFATRSLASKYMQRVSVGGGESGLGFVLVAQDLLDACMADVLP